MTNNLFDDEDDIKSVVVGWPRLEDLSQDNSLFSLTEASITALLVPPSSSWDEPLQCHYYNYGTSIALLLIYSTISAPSSSWDEPLQALRFPRAEESAVAQ